MRTKPPLIPPPAVVLVLLVLSSSLMAIIPLPTIRIPAARIMGVFLVIIGFVCGFSGFSAFRKADTPLRPGDEPTQLVIDGPFRMTRNPMYLGFELLLAGVFFLTQSLFFLVPPAVFFLLMDRLQIPFEEKLMSGRFGQSYTEYCQRVRRWL